jgi:hypothetical protein
MPVDWRPMGSDIGERDERSEKAPSLGAAGLMQQQGQGCMSLSSRIHVKGEDQNEPNDHKPPN